MEEVLNQINQVDPIALWLLGFLLLMLVYGAIRK